uniref:40S ribosomal protein S4 n=1 Tax=Arcella intermedia TaxID=1963864 RepID=A0A6B2LDY3_9EUKA|eukprot:TRINITY_DN24940_c0_g1_i1.p1 TRINITY_DN24940_c0_g1~~TRINITY_DN24940_c0_g1_i1.p1  ORF type:complete len:269 (+),score=32.11 TRINITY_DN24940_c0_g1_i1:42-848(+)
MPRGPKKHLKRINAPKHWMLDKLGGVFAPRPTAGPHKLRECLPLIIVLRNRLKYALTHKEVTMILMQRVVKVDGKVRTDATFPAGFMDVVTIDRTNENFRLLYNVKGRFALHRINEEETTYKLLKVKKAQVGPKGIPYVGTHDGRTIRYPHPDIKVNDVVKFNLVTNKIEEHIKFAVGNQVMVVGGSNLGRVGILKSIDKYPGSHDIVHVEDFANRTFATRLDNVFTIGRDNKALVSLPRGNGVKLSILEEKRQKQKRQGQNVSTTVV